MRNQMILLGSLAIAAAFLFISEQDYKSEKEAEEEYCTMVKTWIGSEGRSGWPPYRDDIVCTLTKVEKRK